MKKTLLSFAAIAAVVACGGDSSNGIPTLKESDVSNETYMMETGKPDPKDGNADYTKWMTNKFANFFKDHKGEKVALVGLDKNGKEDTKTLTVPKDFGSSNNIENELYPLLK